MLNTYAEITRLCNKVDNELKWVFSQTDSELAIVIGYIQCFKLTKLEHPSKDFSIYSDGIWYVVINEAIKKLYKLRA